jgi:hypothetical protein
MQVRSTSHAKVSSTDPNLACAADPTQSHALQHSTSLSLTLAIQCQQVSRKNKASADTGCVKFGFETRRAEITALNIIADSQVVKLPQRAGRGSFRIHTSLCHEGRCGDLNESDGLK